MAIDAKTAAAVSEERVVSEFGELHVCVSAAAAKDAEHVYWPSPRERTDQT
jgi:hypothetical protein